MYMYSCVLQYRINNKKLLGVVSRKLNSWQKQWYHMFLWFVASKFGVWLVVPMTEYSALTFVNTSHAFYKFRTILALFVWGVSLNFTAYRRSRDTGSDLDRASIQRTSVRQLMQPAICSQASSRSSSCQSFHPNCIHCCCSGDLEHCEAHHISIWRCWW